MKRSPCAHAYVTTSQGTMTNACVYCGARQAPLMGRMVRTPKHRAYRLTLTEALKAYLVRINTQPERA